MKQNKQQPNEQTISKGFWIKLGLVPVAMFAFAFALVPLYDTFCDLTGLNGRNSNTQYQGELITDNSKIIAVVPTMLPCRELANPASKLAIPMEPRMGQ